MERAEIDVVGVRDGDAAALNGLAQRRGANVLAYCSQVCGPQRAPVAAAESFARMRAVLRDDVNVTQIDPDGLLRRATRHTAAAAARTPLGPPPGGPITGRETTTCLDVAVALAADADAKLTDEQHGRLHDHIDSCPRCSALAEITLRADTAFSDPSDGRVGTDNVQRFTSAMAAVPADGPGVAAPPTREPEAVASSVFPLLPALADELPLGRGDDEDGEPAVVIALVPDAGERRGGWLRRLLRRHEAEVQAPVEVEPELDFEADGGDADIAAA